MGSYQGIAKTRYVNDKQITDHYAIVPTGQGFGDHAQSVTIVHEKVYEVIARRFLSIFYPAAIYQKYSAGAGPVARSISLPASVCCTEQGYLKVAEVPKLAKKSG